MNRIIGWLILLIDDDIDDTQVWKRSQRISEMPQDCEPIVSLNATQLARIRDHTSRMNFFPQLQTKRHPQSTPKGDQPLKRFSPREFVNHHP